MTGPSFSPESVSDDSIERRRADLERRLDRPGVLNGFMRPAGRRDGRGFEIEEPDLQQIADVRALLPHVGRAVRLGHETHTLTLARLPGGVAMLWGYLLDRRPDLCRKLARAVEGVAPAVKA